MEYGKKLFPQDLYSAVEEGCATAEQHFADLFRFDPRLQDHWQKPAQAQEALLFSFRLGLQHMDHFIARNVANKEPEAVPSNLYSILGLNAITHKVFSAVKNDPWLSRHIDWNSLTHALREAAMEWKQKDFDTMKQRGLYPVDGGEIRAYFDNLESDPWLPGLKEALEQNLRPEELPPAGLDHLFGVMPLPRRNSHDLPLQMH